MAVNAIFKTNITPTATKAAPAKSPKICPGESYLPIIYSFTISNLEETAV